MGVPKHLLSLYQDGTELKTVLACVVKGKLKIEAIDQATLVNPFQQHLEESESQAFEVEELDSTDDAFGFSAQAAPPQDLEDVEEEKKEEPEPEEEPEEAEQLSDSMVETSEEEHLDEAETNEDILHSLMTRVPAKRYAHAINLPRSLAHTLHLRADYSQLKPKVRDRQIFNEIVERLNDTVVPKDHYDCLFTPKGDAYAFVYNGDIPIIEAFDVIQPHLNVKPRFVNVCPDEVALVNLLRYNYDVEEEEIIALINIEDVQSSFIITQGKDAQHFSQSIRLGKAVPSLLNTISGKLLYEQDLGHYPDITRIILTGEARQINAKEFFREMYAGIPVEYFALNPDKFIIPEDSTETFTDYAVPLGIAIQGLFPKKEDTISINLLPDYVFRRQKAFKLAWHGMLLLLLIFLVPIVVNFMHQEKLSTQREAQKKLLSLNNSISDIDWVTYMVDSLSITNSVTKEKLANLTLLSEGTLRWSVTFQQLFTALEEVNGLWVADFKSVGDGIEISGLSLYRNRIPRLIEYFEEAEITSVTPADVRGKKVYKFNLSIKSISADTTAFDPKSAEPPPMPIQSLESSAPITIIKEEEAPAVIDTIPEILIEPELIDTVLTDMSLEQLSDSLLPPEVFDTLMPMTPDISRLADSLSVAATDGEGNGFPVTALKVYRVRRGETLKSIAKQKLGDEKRWREIYNINRDILTSPNRLAINQILIVLQDEEEFRAVTHVVRPNENLKYLAGGYYGDEARWQTLYELNRDNISNPNQIFPGQELTIIRVQQRYGVSIQMHTIRAGESLKQIAEKYLGDKDRWEEIYKMNKGVLKGPNQIFPGQRIKVHNETGVKTSKSNKR